MIEPADPLRVFLDEGVPISVGKRFAEAGHEVIYFKDVATPGSSDQLVCAIAEANNAVLVALDGDMKKLARQYGVGSARFRRLSLIKLSCRETKASSRVGSGMSLVEHEWTLSAGKLARRIFIEMGSDFIRTHR